MQKRGTEMSEIEIEGCILVVGLEECVRLWKWTKNASIIEKGSEVGDPATCHYARCHHDGLGRLREETTAIYVPLVVSRINEP